MSMNRKKINIRNKRKSFAGIDMATGIRTGTRDSSRNMDWQNSVSKIELANLEMLTSKKFCDVTFIVGDAKEKVLAHKLILMSRSSVFETMFQRWETGQNSEIQIPEISTKPFKIFLEYVYSNKCSVKTRNDATEVLYIAHKYNTIHLEKICSEFLRARINVTSAINIQDIAATLDQKNLETEAMNFILQNGNAVFKNAGFIKIKSGTLSTVLQNDNLIIDELTAFRALMGWAKYQCEVQKLACSATNKRKVLKDLIHHIRFPLISSKDFTDEVVRNNVGILTDDEVIGLYMHYNAGQSIRQENLPALPFSNKERGATTPFSCTVTPYNQNVSGTSKYPTCRYYKNKNSRAKGSGDQIVECVEMFDFSTDREIYITAVELHPLSDKREQGQGKLSLKEENVRVRISSLRSNPTTEEISWARTKPNFDKASSTKIYFDKPVKISKYKGYMFSITFSMVESFQRTSNYNAPGSLHAMAKVSYGNNESVNFRFNLLSGSGICYRDSIGIGYNIIGPCIRQGAVKAIHFTV